MYNVRDGYNNRVWYAIICTASEAVCDCQLHKEQRNYRTGAPRVTSSWTIHPNRLRQTWKIFCISVKYPTRALIHNCNLSYEQRTHLGKARFQDLILTVICCDRCRLHHRCNGSAISAFAVPAKYPAPKGYVTNCGKHRRAFCSESFAGSGSRALFLWGNAKEESQDRSNSLFSYAKRPSHFRLLGFLVNLVGEKAFAHFQRIPG